MAPVQKTTTTATPDASATISAKRQRARSLAIAGGLVFLILLFYLITIFKLGGSVVNRSM